MHIAAIQSVAGRIMWVGDLPSDFPTFLARFGTDEACREHVFRMRWPGGFCCVRCGGAQVYAHKKRLIYECPACGKQHSLLAGTIFEQTKTGLAKWFLAIYLVTTSKRGMSAAELKRHMGFVSDQTAWLWLHKIRRAMVMPARAPLTGTIEADEAMIGARRRGKRGRGASGKSIVMCAVETRTFVLPPQVLQKPLQGIAKRLAERIAARAEACIRRCLGRVRLGVVADMKATTLQGFLAQVAAPSASITTDAYSSYARLPARGYVHTPINVSAQPGEAHEYLPAVHLVFAHVKRWLLGTFHGAVRPKHLQIYLEEYTFRFNRRTAGSLCHGLKKLLENALVTPPTTYRQLTGRDLKVQDG